MKYKLENQNTNYSDGRVTFSADFVITDDADTELWRKGISANKKLSQSGWYDLIKQDLSKQAQTIKDKYVTEMAKVLSDTGQSDIASIVIDVSTHVAGGIS